MIRFGLPGEEARLLQDTAERFVADRYGLAQRAVMLARPPQEAPAHWREMAALGWLAAPLPRGVGGLGMAPVHLQGLLETLGAGLILEPYGPAIMNCAATLSRLLPRAQAAGALAPMLAGDRVEVLAASPMGQALVQAEPEGDGWALSGTVPLVPGGAAAHAFWVAVDCGAESALAHVPASKAQVRGFRLVDGQAAASACFDGVSCGPRACFTGAADALAHGADMGLWAALAETSGLIGALCRATLDHVKLRQQFGRPIGRFQVVQHRMADMYMHTEEARSMAQLTAEALEEKDAGVRRRLLSAARVKTDAAARAVLRDAVQLHGGMGMTDELAVGHMVKRLLVLAQTSGSRAAHLKRFQASG